MYNNMKSYGQRDVRREVDNKPEYVVPKCTLSAPLITNKICVYTSSFKDEQGRSTLAYQTADFGFVCRVASVYEPDEDGFIEYDPIHALFNTKGTVPTLYILKSDRLKKMKNIEEEPEKEPLEGFKIDDIDDEQLPF